MEELNPVAAPFTWIVNVPPALTVSTPEPLTLSQSVPGVPAALAISNR